METRRAAAAAGRELLEDKGGIHWIEAPRAVLIEEMSYAEAQELVGLGEPDYDLWPQETRVWFVIFNGRWELTPLDPAQADPQPVTYEGCLLLVFTASDSSLISMGDSVCPST